MGGSYLESPGKHGLSADERRGFTNRTQQLPYRNNEIHMWAFQLQNGEYVGTGREIRNDFLLVMTAKGQG